MEKTRHLHQHEQEKHIHDAPADQAFARTAETFQLISDATRLKFCGCCVIMKFASIILRFRLI